MLRARGEHERHLRHGVEFGGGGVEYDVADLLAGRGASGFARDDDGEAASAQSFGELCHLRTFAGAVETFEGDEFSARSGHAGMIAGGSEPQALGSRVRL